MSEQQPLQRRSHHALFMIGVFFILLSVLSTFCDAKGKGSLYIIGGSKGCGPAILYKSNGKGGKKGETIIMNPCHDDDDHDTHHTTSFIPYPMYYPTGGYDHGYGGYGGGYGGGYKRR